MKRKSNKKLKWYPAKFFMNLCFLLGMLMLAWFVISYIQVLSNQNNVQFTYPNWNMFTWFGRILLKRC